MRYGLSLACTHSHENISGFYRVSVFFFAKVLVDLIPMRVIPLCIYSVIAYFMVGKYMISTCYLFLVIQIRCEVHAHVLLESP